MAVIMVCILKVFVPQAFLEWLLQVLSRKK